jgi:hypothetical protein
VYKIKKLKEKARAQQRAVEPLVVVVVAVAGVERKYVHPLKR